MFYFSNFLFEQGYWILCLYNVTANEEADGGGGSDAGGEEMENPEDHRKRTNPYLRKLDNKSVQLLRRRFIRRLSRARPLYPATLLAFTPFDVFEKRSLKLLNRNGEIIGKRDDFKMNTCFVHKVCL